MLNNVNLSDISLHIGLLAPQIKNIPVLVLRVPCSFKMDEEIFMMYNSLHFSIFLHSFIYFLHLL